MRRHWNLCLILLLMGCASSTLLANDRIWRPFSELEIRGSSIDWDGQANMFLPLAQTDVNLFFADIRGHWNDARAAQGGFGLAFRQMLINDWIFGIHGAYDIRHSGQGNNFHQGMMGLEMLSVNYGLRWNGYLVGDGAKFLENASLVSQVGNSLVIQQASERAYNGTDFEAEALLWTNGRRGWMAFHDMELWGAAGIFHYENNADGFEEITGPRARLEMRFFDIPYAGPDSRFVVSGQYEHDDVRGSVASGFLNVRIPFGRRGSWFNESLRGLNRRMVAPIVRNNDIVTQVGFGAPEAAAFAHSGQVVSQVLTIDANTANPETAIAAAGNNSLVIVDGTAGTLLPANAIDLQSGQVLLGGGSSLELRGVNSGASVSFGGAGTRPTISTSLTNTINAADDSALVAIDLENSGNGLSAISMSNVSNVLIDRVNVDVSGTDTPGILSTGASSFVLSNSVVNTTATLSDAVRTFDDSAYSILSSTLTTSAVDAEGLDASGDSRALISNSSIFTSGDNSEGVLVRDSTQLTLFENSIVTVTGLNTIGVLAAPNVGTDAMTLRLEDVTVNSTSHGIALDTATSGLGTLNAIIQQNSIAATTGSNEIDVQSGGTSTMNLDIDGNTLPALVGTIRLDEIGGDINVTQDAPFTNATGIDAVNGLAAPNVQIPNGAIDFLQPPPVPPLLP